VSEEKGGRRRREKKCEGENRDVKIIIKYVRKSVRGCIKNPVGKKRPQAV